MLDSASKMEQRFRDISIDDFDDEDDGWQHDDTTEKNINWEQANWVDNEAVMLRSQQAFNDLAERLERQNLNEKWVTPDGDSFFVSLSQQLALFPSIRQRLERDGYDFTVDRRTQMDDVQEEVPRASRRCRTDVAEYMSRQPEQLVGIPDKHRSAYVDTIRRPGVWVGLREVEAAANLYGVEIVCFMVSPEGLQESRWTPPHKPDAVLRLVMCGSHFWSAILPNLEPQRDSQYDSIGSIQHTTYVDSASSSPRSPTQGASLLGVAANVVRNAEFPEKKNAEPQKQGERVTVSVGGGRKGQMQPSAQVQSNQYTNMQAPSAAETLPKTATAAPMHAQDTQGRDRGDGDDATGESETRDEDKTKGKGEQMNDTREPGDNIRWIPSERGEARIIQTPGGAGADQMTFAEWQKKLRDIPSVIKGYWTDLPQEAEEGGAAGQPDQRNNETFAEERQAGHSSSDSELLPPDDDYDSSDSFLAVESVRKYMLPRDAPAQKDDDGSSQHEQDLMEEFFKETIQLTTPKPAKVIGPPARKQPGAVEPPAPQPPPPPPREPRQTPPREQPGNEMVNKLLEQMQQMEDRRMEQMLRLQDEQKRLTEKVCDLVGGLSQPQQSARVEGRQVPGESHVRNHAAQNAPMLNVTQRMTKTAQTDLEDQEHVQARHNASSRQPGSYKSKESKKNSREERKEPRKGKEAGRKQDSDRRGKHESTRLRQGFSSSTDATWLNGYPANGAAAATAMPMPGGDEYMQEARMTAQLMAEIPVTASVSNNFGTERAQNRPAQLWDAQVSYSSPGVEHVDVLKMIAERRRQMDALVRGTDWREADVVRGTPYDPNMGGTSWVMEREVSEASERVRKAKAELDNMIQEAEMKKLHAERMQEALEEVKTIR
jgi:hypothetical protein